MSGRRRFACGGVWRRTRTRRASDVSGALGEGLDDLPGGAGREDETAPPGVAGRRRLLRDRDWIVWWIGGSLSSLGSGLSSVAFPLLILVATGSAARAGVVGACESFGVLTSILMGGELADRVSRRALLIVVPVFEAAALGTVAVAVAAGDVSVVHVAAVGLIIGITEGLRYGSETATMCRLVARELYADAIAQTQGREMAVKLAGPAIGGWLFGFARWAPFVGDALSYLAASAATSLVRTPLGPDRVQGAKRERIVARLVEGWRFIRSNPYLRFVTTWAALVNATTAALLLLVTVLVRHRGGSPAVVGATQALGAAGGIGGVVLSSAIARWLRARTLVLALSGMLPLACTVIALAPSPWVMAAPLALLLFLIGPINVILETYELRMIPEGLMGRVSTMLTLCVQSLRWSGPLAAGGIAQAYGPTAAALSVAGVFALMAAAMPFVGALRVLDGRVGT